MRFPTKTKIMAIAPTEDSRYAMSAVLVRRKGDSGPEGEMVATDGRCMVAVNCDLDEDDELPAAGRLVTPAALKLAIESLGRMHLNGSIVVVHPKLGKMELAEKEGVFPDYRSIKVDVERERKRISVQLDARLLAKLQAAWTPQKWGEGEGVKLEIALDSKGEVEDSPIIVTPLFPAQAQGWGMVMPISAGK